MSESDEDMGFEKLPSEAPEKVDENTPPHSDADTTEDESEDTDVDSASPISKIVEGKFSESQDEKVSRRSDHLDLPPRRVLASAEENSPHRTAPAAPLESSLNDVDGSETSDDEL